MRHSVPLVRTTCEYHSASYQLFVTPDRWQAARHPCCFVSWESSAKRDGTHWGTFVSSGPSRITQSSLPSVCVCLLPSTRQICNQICVCLKCSPAITAAISSAALCGCNGPSRLLPVGRSPLPAECSYCCFALMSLKQHDQCCPHLHLI